MFYTMISCMNLNLNLVSLLLLLLLFLPLLLKVIIHREYNSRNKSCDIIVREAEKELYEDNFLLFLMYKACRDLYCHIEVSLFVPLRITITVTVTVKRLLWIAIRNCTLSCMSSSKVYETIPA